MENTIYIPVSPKDITRVSELKKVGGLNKANRLTKIRMIRENLETAFIHLAELEAKKVFRAENQRADRRAKR